jgi:hypothetical protein
MKRYSPNHPAVKSWDRPLDIRSRTQAVRDRLGMEPLQMNYKARTFFGFMFCIGSFYALESSALLCFILLGLAGYCWISSINDYTR